MAFRINYTFRLDKYLRTLKN